MAERWAVATGNWSATGTWNGGTLPGAGDDVYANGYTVTINQDVTVASVRTTAGTTPVAGGGFTLNGGVTLTAKVYAGTTAAITFSASTTSNIIGNIYASTTTGGSAGSGVSFTGTGILNVTGNVYGGSVSATCIGVYMTGGGAKLVVTGDCIGGSHATSYCSGVLANASVTIEVYGTAVGGTGGALSTGVSFPPAGSVFVQVAKSNDYPNSGITVSVPGLTVQGASVLPVIDAMEYGSGGAAPVSSPRCFIRDAGTNFVKMRQSNNGAITVMGEVSNDYPAQANVRLGVSYDFGAKTGTCAVPPAGSVALGVPVDATTGTATLSPTALLGADLKTRLESCATVQTVGDQLAALGA